MSRGFNFANFTVLKNSRKFLSIKIIFYHTNNGQEKKNAKLFLVNRLKGDFCEIFSHGNIPPIQYILSDIMNMHET